MVGVVGVGWRRKNQRVPMCVLCPSCAPVGAVHTLRCSPRLPTLSCPRLCPKLPSVPFSPHLGEAPRVSGRAVLVCAWLLRRKKLFYSILCPLCLPLQLPSDIARPQLPSRLRLGLG